MNKFLEFLIIAALVATALVSFIVDGIEWHGYRWLFCSIPIAFILSICIHGLRIRYDEIEELKKRIEDLENEKERKRL
jgi:bacteriorhodopsin